MTPAGLALVVLGVTLIGMLIPARLFFGLGRVTKPEPLGPARDGAQIGYEHPAGWPVRIVQGFPVALAPDGRCDRWHAAYQEWRPADPALAAEARSRFHLEETQVDESLPVAEPLGPYTVPPVPPDAPQSTNVWLIKDSRSGYVPLELPGLKIEWRASAGDEA